MTAKAFMVFTAIVIGLSFVAGIYIAAGASEVQATRWVTFTALAWLLTDSFLPKEKK